MNKRLLSILLVLCMVLNMLSISVIAKEADVIIGTSGEINYVTPLTETEETIATEGELVDNSVVMTTGSAIQEGSQLPLTIDTLAVGDRFVAPITIGSNTNVSWKFIILTEPDSETNGTVVIFSPNSGLEQKYTGDLIIPETVTNNGKTYNVTELSSHTFNSCNMTSVFIPKTMGGSIGSDVFSGSPNLAAFIVDPENTAFCSEDGVLYNKDKTTLIRYPVAKTNTTFSIPTSVSTLYSCAFLGCKNITSMDIPETVTTMGESHLFYGCTTLREVTIPSGVSDIPHATFMGCTALQRITFKGLVAPVLNQYAFVYSPEDLPIDLKIIIPAGSVGYSGEGVSDAWKALADKIVLPPVINYNVWVGGIQVTSGNGSNVLGDGKVSYIPATDTIPQTLKLTGASITTAHEFDFNPYSKGVSGIYVKGDLNLVLIDNNSIGGSSFDTSGAVSAGIFVSQGNLNISGTGNLTASAGKADNSSTGVNIENFDKCLTISDGANVTAIGGNAFYSRGVFVNGSLMIDGGSLTAKGDHSGDSSISYGVNGAYINSTFTIKNGGSLTAVGGKAKYTSGGAFFNNISNNIIVDGGSLTASASDAESTSIGIKGDTISINGATVTASGKKQAIKAVLTFGSSFAHKNTAGLIADGSGTTVLKDSELASGIDGYKYVKIEPAPKVARIGSKSYVTLQEAFDEVTDGQTIQLQNDIILDKTVTISSGNTNSFALDLNGKTLDGGQSVCITHEGSGTLTLTDSSEEKDGIVVAALTVFGLKGGRLVIDSGTVESIQGTAIFNNMSSSVSITGGTVTTNSTQPAIVNHVNDGLRISGGTVINTGDGPAISTVFDKKITISNTARVISGNKNEYSDKSTIWLKGGTGSNTILEITGGTIENTATEGYAIYNSGFGGIVAIPSGSPVIRGGYAAKNTAPDLNSYIKAHVTASANFDGSSPVNEYVAHNISLYRYLTFEQSVDNTVTNLNLSDKLTAPVMGAIPELSITDDQYRGTVTWNTTPTKFLGSIAYTATVILVATDGYTFSGVEQNTFNYIGATSITNYTGYGKTLTVTIVFPQTEAKVLQSDNSSPVIVTQPILDKPNSPTQGEIKIPGKVDKKGNTKVNITDRTVIDAIEKAVEDAKKNGNEQNGIAVVLRVDTGNKVSSNVTVNLPKTVQNIIIEKKIVNILVVVDNPDIRIGMDLATIKEINKQAKSDVNITATRMDSGKLTGNAKKAIGSRSVFDLKVNYGKGKQVKNFGSGSVWVTIPYSLGANEKAGNVQAVYVDDKNKVQWLTNSFYDSVEKVLRFRTNHFSTYGIGYQKTNTAFTDIADHWTKEDIEFVVSRGLLSGISDTTFSPNAAMTRGMFVTALGRLANVDVSGYKKSSFTDVNKDAYYMGYIEWASKNNIVTDTGNGTFSPDMSINREQMAVILENYAKAIGFTLPKVYVENSFVDSHKISAYAKDAVKHMQMGGVLYSKNGNLFDPLSTATRAEVSVVLRRFVELTISCDIMWGWAQNDSGEWLYYKNGKALTGMQTIDGIQYYFNTNGILITGTNVPK